jgi:1,2-diacylglycerol 3-alpha-glucosyltransferase
VRIGLILDAYKPVINGITNFVALYKRRLEAAGHEPVVFTWNAPGYVDDEPGVERSSALFPLGATGYAFGLRYTRRAQARLRSLDVVHVHHPFLGGLMALRYARPHGIPIVYTNHTRYDLYARHYAALPPALAGRLVGAYLRAFCARCDAVVAPARGLAGVLAEWGVRVPVEVIPNGVDLARFAPGAHGLERAALDLPAEAVVLVYTGRLGPEKNLEGLLDAFAQAHARAPELRLLLVGGGPQEAALRAQANAAVTFAGAVVYERIPDYLALADAFVTASISEVHPLSAIEAQAAGLPVVGPDAPGVRDVVRDSQDGLLCAPEPDALAEALVRLARDPALRAQLAAGARAARGALDIDATVARYLACYARVCAPRGAATANVR